MPWVTPPASGLAELRYYCDILDLDPAGHGRKHLGRACDAACALADAPVPKCRGLTWTDVCTLWWAKLAAQSTLLVALRARTKATCDKLPA